MSPTFAGPLGVLASLSLIVVAIVVSMREGLGLERSIAWAAIRAVVQLTAIGLALGLILADDAPIALSFAWLVGMVTIGASTVAARTRATNRCSSTALVRMSFRPPSALTGQVVPGRTP